MKKKFLSVFLTLVMAVTVLSQKGIEVNADGEEVIIDSIIYNLNENANEATVKGVSGVLPENVTILPAIVKDGIEFKVTEISANAFVRRGDLKEINIPDSVTKICDSAFKDSNLQNIKIPNSVIEMYSEVFYGCRELRTVELSNNPEFKSIWPGMFRRCCCLTNIKIPKNVTVIGEEAFYGSGLKNVEFSNELESINQDAFACCGELETVNLPNSLTFIGDWAFANSGIKRISLPSNLKYLGCGAFESSELTTIEFPDDYKFSVIKQGTFKDCENLKQVVIPFGVSKIETEAFAYSGLELATLPEGVVLDVKGEGRRPFTQHGSDYEKGSFFGCRNLTISYRSEAKPV